MNSIAIGEQLKNAREARGLTLEYVAEETNIAKRYITAMESEDFSIFPGDPYIIGFLRNYSEYLGLDSASIVQAFHGIRIQEQPVPIEDLLSTKKAPIWPFVLIAIVVILGVGGFFAYKYFLKPEKVDEETLVVKEPIQYKLESIVFEKRVYEGDSILIPFNGDNYKLEVTSIDEKVSISTPTGISRYMLGEEGTIDLNKDNIPELNAFIVDFQKGNTKSGAALRLTVASDELKETLASLEKTTENEDNNTTSSQKENAVALTNTNQNSMPTNVNQVSTQKERPATQEDIIFSGKRSPYPFVVNVTFRSYAMFRHEVDRKERTEHYYHKGDQITVTANNQAKLWTSNAAACKLTIQASGGQSKDVELGSPGVVAVKQVRWTQGEDGLWSLCLFDVN